MHLITNDKDIRIPLTKLVKNYFESNCYNHNINDDTFQLGIRYFNQSELSDQLEKLNALNSEDGWALQLSGRNYFLKKNAVNGIGILTQHITNQVNSNYPNEKQTIEIEQKAFFYIGKEGIKFELSITDDYTISLTPKISTVNGFVFGKNTYFRSLIKLPNIPSKVNTNLQVIAGDIYLNQFYSGEGKFYNCGKFRKIFHKSLDLMDRMSNQNDVHLEFNTQTVSELSKDDNNLACLNLLNNSRKAH